MFNVKMSKGMEKTCKAIGLACIIFVVFITTMITCELIYTTASYLNRGFDLETAMEWAIDDVDYELEQISEYLENILPKRERRNEITEYPIANWNITWNVMNKP